MPEMDTAHKGAQSELIACAWLLSQGYEVFRNVAATGAIDIIAMRDGELHYFDVKSVAYGVRVPFLKQKQVELGVRRIVQAIAAIVTFVTPKSTCSVVSSPSRLSLGSRSRRCASVSLVNHLAPSNTDSSDRSNTRGATAALTISGRYVPN
jgi:Holliday junction resolvase-like predicted endonuclease